MNFNHFPAAVAVLARLLLRNISSPKEVDYYLKTFANADARSRSHKLKRFAVLKVGGDVVRKELDTLASSVSFLHNLGLTPILLHGAGPQLNIELERSGIEPAYTSGSRITDARTLRVARRVFHGVNAELVHALERVGAKARPITNGIFEAEVAEEGRLGLVGAITAVNTDIITDSISHGYLPVLTSLAETPGGQILNVNADVAARELAIAISPLKVIFLSSQGGWLDDEGNILSTIDMSRDYNSLIARDYTDRHGTLLKMVEIKKLLDALPRSSSVVITAPAKLTKELFTHKGAGTYITYGEHIGRYSSLGHVDMTRLQRLLESSFGYAFDYRYFETLPKRLDALYLSESYSACAIVTKGGVEIGHTPYLCKFAVSKEAQGQGQAGKHPRSTDSLGWQSYLF